MKVAKLIESVLAESVKNFGLKKVRGNYIPYENKSKLFDWEREQQPMEMQIFVDRVYSEIKKNYEDFDAHNYLTKVRSIAKRLGHKIDTDFVTDVLSYLEAKDMITFSYCTNGDEDGYWMTVERAEERVCGDADEYSYDDEDSYDY